MDSSSNSSSLQSHLGSVAGRRGRRGACATPSASPTDRQQQRAGARSPRQERTLAPPPHTPLPPTFPRPFPTLCSSPPIRLHASVHCFGAPRAPPIRPPPPIRQPPSVRTYPPPPSPLHIARWGRGSRSFRWFHTLPRVRPRVGRRLPPPRRAARELGSTAAEHIRGSSLGAPHLVLAPLHRAETATAKKMSGSVKSTSECKSVRTRAGGPNTCGCPCTPAAPPPSSASAPPRRPM